MVYVVIASDVQIRMLAYAEVNVPVVGGHAGITILPLFSQVTYRLFSFLYTAYHFGLFLFSKCFV